MSAPMYEAELCDLDFEPECFFKDAPAVWVRRTVCGAVSLYCDACHHKIRYYAERTFAAGGCFVCSKCHFIARSHDDLDHHDTVKPL